MKAVNVGDVLKILHKYGEYIFVTDEKKYSDMVDEIANLKALEQESCGDAISREMVLDKIKRDIIQTSKSIEYISFKVCNSSVEFQLNTFLLQNYFCICFK